MASGKQEQSLLVRGSQNKDLCNIHVYIYNYIFMCIYILLYYIGIILELYWNCEGSKTCDFYTHV